MQAEQEYRRCAGILLVWSCCCCCCGKIISSCLFLPRGPSRCLLSIIRSFLCWTRFIEGPNVCGCLPIDHLFTARRVRSFSHSCWFSSTVPFTQSWDKRHNRPVQTHTRTRAHTLCAVFRARGKLRGPLCVGVVKVTRQFRQRMSLSEVSKVVFWALTELKVSPTASRHW